MPPIYDPAVNVAYLEVYVGDTRYHLDISRILLTILPRISKATYTIPS